MTRPAIIGLLKNAVKDGVVQIPDEDIIQELKEFVISTNGKAEALPGCHDDCVIATAIALEVYRTHADRLSTNKTAWDTTFTNTVQDNTQWL